MNRRRSRSRGVTPIGAALAALALGIGATGLMWLHNSGSDAESEARSDANQIQVAAQRFRAQHNDGCPTLSQLAEERFLSREARQDDTWGNRFRIRCEDDQLLVISAGPDGKPNTADDIRVGR